MRSIDADVRTAEEEKNLNRTVPLNSPNCGNVPLHFALEDLEKSNIKSGEYLRLQ